MRKVKGYLTDDAMFFETKEDAELHEATRALEYHARVLQVRPDALVHIISELIDLVERYVRAKREQDAKQGRANEHPSNNITPEATDVPILKFEARRDEPMPDVGDGQRLETLRYSSKVYGPRGWGDDASGIRSGEDLATGQDTGIHEARGERGEEDIWDGEMEEVYSRLPRRQP